MAARRPQVDSFDVNVKDFQGSSMVIKVNHTWDVGRVKQEIAQRRSMQPHDFKLVFAGQTLADKLTLMDIGVQGYSTLHCIRGRGVEVQMTSPTRLLDHMAGDLATLPTPTDQVGNPTATLDSNSSAPKHRFYVYCKHPCGKMSPGKLRVRCADCKDAAFVLDGGPGEWDDVLTPKKLHGQCHNQNPPCGGRDAEFYFKCANHSTSDTDVCVALHMVRANTLDVDCASCLAAQDLVVVFKCQDQHCLCVDCFQQYCEVQLTNRQFEEHRQIGYTIRCPAGCDGSQITESHHFRMLGKDLYDRYQRFGTEEFVLQMGGVLCPHANCGMGLLPEDQRARVHCPRENGGCGFTFCRLCKEAYHNGPCRQTPQETQPGGQPYHLSEEALQRSRWNQASERFIESNTKACPRCRVPIEKNGGCMHMACSRAACRYEWCWMCGTPWNRQCQSTHWFG